MFKFALLTVLLISACSSLALTEEEVSSFAMKHYPTELLDEWRVKNGEAEPNIGFLSVIADFSGNGEETLLVAYANTFSVRLAMLDLDGALLTTHGDLPKFEGFSLEIHAFDFDGNGVPEIALKTRDGFSVSSPALSYVMQWDGEVFNLLTPLVDDLRSEFIGTSFLDLESDGRYEITRRSKEGQIEIHRYVDGGFQHTGDLAYLGYFGASDGRENGRQEVFKADPTVDYEIVLLNAPNKQSYATAGYVQINGVEVVSTNHFHLATRRTELGLGQLKADNSIEVKIKGEPNAFVQVYVQPIRSLN